MTIHEHYCSAEDVLAVLRNYRVPEQSLLYDWQMEEALLHADVIINQQASGNYKVPISAQGKNAELLCGLAASLAAEYCYGTFIL